MLAEPAATHKRVANGTIKRKGLDTSIASNGARVQPPKKTQNEETRPRDNTQVKAKAHAQQTRQAQNKTKQNKTSQNHNAQSRGSHHCRLRLRLPVLPPLSESSLLRPIAWRVPERERRLLNHTRTRENVRFNSSASSCTRSGLG